ncbi:hypothetical protein [Qipengyuania proteolytica]|nr:hypothetical protein [Qipengyuania proteolytica]
MPRFPAQCAAAVAAILMTLVSIQAIVAVPPYRAAVAQPLLLA